MAKRNWKTVLGACLIKAAEKHKNLVLVSADSGPNSGFEEFIAKFPTRFFEFGIMEPSVTCVASGMATAGLLPVFCAPAPFITGRAYEMVRIDIGYMRQNVKLIGRNAGFSYSDLGPTHYGLDDIGLIRLIPDVVLLAPQFADELESAFEAMMDYEGPIYMRVCNSSLPDIGEKEPFVIGKGKVLAEGGDVAIIATGNRTHCVLEALPLLYEHGINPMVIGMPTIIPIDVDLVKKAAELGKVVTVEEHFVDGGFGTIVADTLATHCPAKLLKLGVPNEYATSGGYDEMAEFYGLDASGIAKTVCEFVKNSPRA